MNINRVVNGFLLATTIFLLILVFSLIRFLKFKIRHKGIGKAVKLFKRRKKDKLTNNNFESAFGKDEKQKYLKMKIFLLASTVIWFLLLVTTLVLQEMIGGGL